MRTLTLADALRERGADVEFICREHSGNLIEVVKKHGYPCHQLPLQSSTPNAENGTAHAAWLGASWQEDAAATQQALSHKTYDWLIVDHYALDSQWERAMRPYTDKILVIDDLADRHHDADLLLDQTLGRTPEAYQKLVPRTTQCLTGTTYALVRPEFSAIRDNARLHRAHQFPPKNLLIFFGGIDQHNLTGTALRALLIENPFTHIDVVLGGTAQHVADVTALCKTLHATLHIQCSNMHELMGNANLALGAPGSTSWERCTLGLPTLLVISAENQRSVAHALANTGAASLIGEADQITPPIIQSALRVFLNKNSAEYHQIIENCRKVCDGLGVHRITKYLLTREGA